jgi:hypothetical protein
VARGGGEGGVGPSLVFYPLQRVEKVLLDESQGGLPSFADRFASRTGLELGDALSGGSGRS